MKRSIAASAVLPVLLLTSACTVSNNESSSQPQYNSAVTSAHTVKTSEKTTTSAQEGIRITPEVSFFPIINTVTISSGNCFEQQQYFGFYCKADSGFYYADRTGDGFLYHYDNGQKTLVLEEYTRALHYYEGKIYYLKGSKEQFTSKQHFYSGDVWCYDTAAGKETCVIEGIPENMCLAVNQYGIFCNPCGGGVAQYDFSGNMIRVLSDINQNICIMDNYICLKQDNDCILLCLDDGSTVSVPEMDVITAYRDGKIVYTDIDNQSKKYVADAGTGEIKPLPLNEAYSFAWLGDELYASDNHHIYRVNLSSCKYEPVVTLDNTGQITVFCLFSDGEKLFAEVVNQSGRAAIAGVDISENTLIY